MGSTLPPLADNTLNPYDNQFDGKKDGENNSRELPNRLMKIREEFGLRQNHRKIPFPHLIASHAAICGWNLRPQQQTNSRFVGKRESRTSPSQLQVFWSGNAKTVSK
ncbi:MAG: hypothetical protein WAL95_02865 [Candidatus Acidiferrales bacterium]